VNREGIRLDLRNIRNLKTLPVIAIRIQEVATDAGASANQLAEVVAQDQATSAKVLSLANSAFYGFSRKISTIRQAVVVLGFDTIRSLALSVAVYDTFSEPSGVVNFDREAFWMNSIGCGTASRLVAKEMELRDRGTYFSAGLLHDLGKIILDMHSSDQYRDVVAQVAASGRPARDVELELLDIDHSEVGGLLAQQWKFPEVLVNPISFHHDPLSANPEFLRETLVVHLGDILARRADIGMGTESRVPEPVDLVYSELGLSDDQIDRIEVDLEEEKDPILEFLSLLSG